MSAPEYVLGFLFSESTDVVLLMQKARPAWQRGRFNGIGGRVEEGETVLAAMEREAMEEAGVFRVHWHHFATMTDECSRVYVFRGIDEQIKQADNTDKSEPLVWCHSRALPDDVLPNLHWMIPMALDGGVAGVAEVRYSRALAFSGKAFA